MDKREEFLKLDNQLCFALYSASRAIVRAYKPLLDKLGVTYTQYITLMVLWEDDGCNMNFIGRRLGLDSGTLTPLLKKMEKDNLIKRQRDESDERNIKIFLTEKGKELKVMALNVPEKMVCKLPFEFCDIEKLRDVLKQLYQNIKI